jgi:hypothetical protein
VYFFSLYGGTDGVIFFSTNGFVGGKYVGPLNFVVGLHPGTLRPLVQQYAPLPPFRQQSALSAPLVQQYFPFPPFLQQSGLLAPFVQQYGPLPPFLQQSGGVPPCGQAGCVVFTGKYVLGGGGGVGHGGITGPFGCLQVHEHSHSGGGHL